MLSLLCAAPSVMLDDQHLGKSIVEDDLQSSQSSEGSVARAASRLRRNVLRKASVSSRASGSKLKLNISPPSAFRHYFHLGNDVGSPGTVDFSARDKLKEAWDEDKWRQVIEMRMSLDSNARMHALQPDPPSPLMTMPAQTYPAGGKQDYKVATFMSTSTIDISAAASSSSDCTTKTPRALKRTSLVKRKPVPPLYPDEPLPPRSSVESSHTSCDETKSRLSDESKASQVNDGPTNDKINESPRPSLVSVDSHDSGSTAPPPTPVDTADIIVNLLDKITVDSQEEFTTATEN